MGGNWARDRHADVRTFTIAAKLVPPPLGRLNYHPVISTDVFWRGGAVISVIDRAKRLGELGASSMIGFPRSCASFLLPIRSPTPTIVFPTPLVVILAVLTPFGGWILAHLVLATLVIRKSPIFSAKSAPGGRKGHFFHRKRTIGEAIQHSHTQLLCHNGFFSAPRRQAGILGENRTLAKIRTCAE